MSFPIISNLDGTVGPTQTGKHGDNKDDVDRVDHQKIFPSVLELLTTLLADFTDRLLHLRRSGAGMGLTQEQLVGRIDEFSVLVEIAHGRTLLNGTFTFSAVRIR